MLGTEELMTNPALFWTATQSLHDVRYLAVNYRLKNNGCPKCQAVYRATCQLF